MAKIIFEYILLSLISISLGCSNIEKIEFEKSKEAFDSEDYETAIEYFKKVVIVHWIVQLLKLNSFSK